MTPQIGPQPGSPAGAPQQAHTSRGTPASMQMRASSGGKVAKCASLNGLGAIVQTLRLLRVSTRSTTAASKLAFCFTRPASRVATFLGRGTRSTLTLLLGPTARSR